MAASFDRAQEERREVDRQRSCEGKHPFPDRASAQEVAHFGEHYHVGHAIPPGSLPLRRSTI